jgi:Protein of unknown function (DUF1569)
MPSIFDPGVEAATRSRVARLTADSPARWGRMNAAEMLCHLADSFRLALGESSATPKSSPLRWLPMRLLFVYLLPWPKGKLPTMREFQQTRPAAWDRDRQDWESALSRMVARGREPGPLWSPHPAFGPLPNWEWGRLTYRHIDHHLRQFGV